MSRHQLKPQPTAAERMERKRQAKEQPKTNYYQLQKYAALRYDYSAIDGEQRQAVMDAALEIHKWQRRMAEDTIRLGALLLEVKAILPHGKFAEWWQQEFDLSPRVIQGMMNAATVYGDPANARRVAHLSDGALYLLAAPSTPVTVRWEVFERMEMLDFRPTRAQIKAIIDAHKPPRPKQLAPGRSPAPPLGAPPVPQLTGPVEHEIALPTGQASQPSQRSPQEIAGELSLSECLMVLELAKEAAKRARELAPVTVNSVTDMLPSISRLIHKIEQELRK
jgi:hypothetical protein